MNDPTASEKRKSARILMIGIAAVAVVVLLYLRACQPIETDPLRISIETTRVLGPLGPHGGVDFIAAIEEHREAAAPEGENAARALLRVVGAAAFEGAETETTRKILRLLDPEFHRERESVLDLRGLDFEFDYTRFDQPLPDSVKEWALTQRKGLGAFVNALTHPRFHVPLVHNREFEGVALVDCGYDFLDSITVAFGLPLAAHARVALHDDQLDDALDSALACERLAGLLLQRPSLTSFAAAQVAKRKSAALLYRIVEHPRVTASQVDRIRNALVDVPPTYLVDSVDRTQRLILLEDLAVALREGSDPTTGMMHLGPQRAQAAAFLAGSCFDANAIFTGINESFDHVVHGTHGKSFRSQLRALEFVDQVDARTKEIAQDVTSIGGRLKFLLSPSSEKRALSTEYLSKFFVALVLPHVRQHVAGVVEWRASTAVLRVAAELRKGNLEGAPYPTSLNDLQRQRSVRIRDPFTDAPLEYKVDARGCIVQSLGWRLHEPEKGADPRFAFTQERWADAVSGEADLRKRKRLWSRLPRQKK